jgi:hypothetical protein
MKAHSDELAKSHFLPPRNNTQYETGASGADNVVGCDYQICGEGVETEEVEP